MQFGREVRRRARAAIAPVVFLAVAGYFGWSAARGGHGLVAYAQRQALLTQAQSDLARLQARQADWERRVAALRTDHLDPDLLNERAREMLNLSNPHDILVPYPQGESPVPAGRASPVRPAGPATALQNHRRSWNFLALHARRRNAPAPSAGAIQAAANRLTAIRLTLSIALHHKTNSRCRACRRARARASAAQDRDPSAAGRQAMAQAAEKARRGKPRETTIDKDQLLRAYHDMLLIRRFEEKAGQLYGMGLIGGFCHLYIGQEAVVVGMQMAVGEGDQVITSYRDHGHMLATGMDPKGRDGGTHRPRRRVFARQGRLDAHVQQGRRISSAATASSARRSASAPGSRSATGIAATTGWR